jgi:hypothetical protein
VKLIFPNILSTYFNIFIICITINTITFLYYAYIVYNGTSFKKVFSPCNQIVMAVLFLAFGTFTFWAVYSYKLIRFTKGSSRFFSQFQNSVLMIVIINVMHIGYVMLSFIYFGSIARKFDEDTNELLIDFEEARDLDKHIDELKIIRPERCEHLQENTAWFKHYDLPDDTVSHAKIF